MLAPYRFRIVRGLGRRKTVLLLRHMGRGVVEGESGSEVRVNLYLDNKWRWVATILERAPEAKDQITACRTHDWDEIKEFLTSDANLRPAAVEAIRDLGLPVRASILT